MARNLNRYLAVLGTIETYLLIVLCIARYMTIKNPFGSARNRNIGFSASILIIFVLLIFLAISDDLLGSLTYFRVTDSVMSFDFQSIDNEEGVSWHIWVGVLCFSLLIEGVFGGLTILHLKNSDTAESSSSSKNLRKSIFVILFMNAFNALLIVFGIALSVTEHILKDNRWEKLSTTIDFIEFSNMYGLVVLQSAFNSVSFLIICSSFRVFVRSIFNRITSRVGKLDPPKVRSQNGNPRAETVT